MKIIKRDNRVKDFSFSRIEKAVDNAFSDVYTELDYSDKINEVLSNVMEEIIRLDVEVMSVEEIQDIIVSELSKVDKVVAKSYEEYRSLRSFEREKRSDSNYEIEKIINSVSEESTSNGNVDGSKIQSIRALVANIFTRKYAEWRYIPLDLQKKQRKELYYHDAQYVGMPFFNCCNVEWQDMFRTGFELGTAKIETPKSLATAVNVLTQVASHISSNTYGGTTFGNLGEGLLPYAKKSLKKHREVANKYISKERVEEYAWERLEKEIKDSIQSLEYEIQTLVTSRGETPFLTLGLDIPREDYSEEDRKIHNMIIEAILKQRLEGLTGGVTPVFPKLVFQLKDGVNLRTSDKEYEMFKLASKVSAKRQYPDYVMTDKLKEVTGGFKFPMGCRSFKVDGKFNWGVISINLTRLAIMSNGDENKFYELLQEQLNDCERFFKIRYDILKNVKAKQSPILYMSGAIARLNAEDTIERLLYKDWSSISIGYVGLQNCLKALYGEGLENQNMDIVKKGSDIMQYIRDFCDKKKDETGLGYSTYGSPAETLATKFCEEDVKDFGVIEGVNDNGYYENSFHYPSNSLISPFEKLDLESNLSKISSGGAISFIELGDMNKNLEAMEEIIRYAYDKTHFLGISSISDKCLKCNYDGEILTKQNSNFEFQCPNCGNDNPMTLSIIRKLCGYCGSIFERPCVSGKMKEIKNRVNHKGCN
ncbi:anaerobic ribonucleoside-triphosphate reductase [Clostridium sp.]|uniref:anaerobic ribonucleoside-triphosphate reductase n=1 Tax=Clostridium sp. TaxID=1506 RepID=UPI00290C0756|nr:anaerobic ribonucleoside-triphosphate reductase [Clostridium sp.]MDU3410149.1 anaerobic ribonucleoside-triphosphate reductase [Clostridium sp.]